MSISPSDEPFLVCTYGASGIGKTTDQGYSFPRGLFIAAPGALTSIETTCGYRPDRADLKTLKEANALIDQISKSRKYDTIIFDDFSFLAQQTLNQLETSGKTGFKLWDAMRDLALEFRDKARYCKVNVVLNAWEAPPRTKPDGTRIRGGPQLPSNLPEQIPAMCDVVLRALHEPARQPWPAVYRCSPDPSYAMKDRFGTAARVDPSPMNLAELLRASGRVIARHGDLPNQEAEVEAISQSLSGNIRQDMPLVNQVFKALLDKGHSTSVARWTMRDAVDRAVIRSAVQASSQTFFNPNSTSFLG